jgi:hypothetical protein
VRKLSWRRLLERRAHSCDRVRKRSSKGAFLGRGAQERSRSASFVRRGALEAKCAQAKGRGRYYSL